MQLDDWGLSTARLIGGFSGSVVHIFTAKQLDALTVVGSVVVGTLTANFLGPAAAHYAPDWLGQFGPAFIVGYFAIIILQWLETVVRAKLQSLKTNGERPS